MLSEMQFENNADGGDVHILFDKTAIRKKPFDKKKLLWLIGALGIAGLVIGNIWAGWGTWGKDKRPSSVSPTPVLDANSFNSSLNVKIKDFSFDLHWHINFDDETVQFHVITKNGSEFSDTRWLLIGFSNSGSINKSDYCVFKNKNLTDGYINFEGALITDTQQDCTLLQSDQTGFSFTRKLATCDPRDVVFSKGTTTIFFTSDVTEAPNSNEPIMRNAKLFTKIHTQAELESDAKAFALTAVNLTVASGQDFCMISKVPDEVVSQKHHIVRIEPLITTGNERSAAQIELYFCSYNGSTPLQYNGSCLNGNTSTCTKSVYIWSLGGSPMDFPKEAGLPIGGSPANVYLMVKIKYANKNSILDSSGLQIYYTSTLRANDAGILELGISSVSTEAIPSQQPAFALSGFCPTACSDKFPDSGITVFASRLHTHSAGKLIRTSIYRNGKRKGDLNFDHHFEAHWAVVDELDSQVTVEKGDSLMTTCVYNTMGKDSVTLLGQNPENEMCINTVYYYPAMALMTCRSSVSEDALKNWFIKKGKQDDSEPLSKKFNDLTWSGNKSAVNDLIELYSTSPIKGECQTQSGIMLEGVNLQGLKRPLISKSVEEARIKYECPSIDDLSYS